MDWSQSICFDAEKIIYLITKEPSSPLYKMKISPPKPLSKQELINCFSKFCALQSEQNVKSIGKGKVISDGSESNQSRFILSAIYVISSEVKM